MKGLFTSVQHNSFAFVDRCGHTFKISKFEHGCEYEFNYASEWRFECGYDYEFWVQTASTNIIVSISIAVCEYECECEHECKPDSEYKY